MFDEPRASNRNIIDQFVRLDFSPLSRPRRKLSTSHNNLEQMQDRDSIGFLQAHDNLGLGSKKMTFAQSVVALHKLQDRYNTQAPLKNFSSGIPFMSCDVIVTSIFNLFKIQSLW